jgi:uncharacterized repeat protein (TIGR03987 family)
VPIILIAVIIVNLALITYSIGVITEQRKKTISNKTLGFLTVGVVFDCAATVCMIIGSSTEGITLHGILGYSALLVMLTDGILWWKFRLKNAQETAVPKKLHLYSRYAYYWWVIAYITGAIIVAVRG